MTLMKSSKLQLTIPSRFVPPDDMVVPLLIQAFDPQCSSILSLFGAFINLYDFDKLVKMTFVWFVAASLLYTAICFFLSITNHCLVQVSSHVVGIYYSWIFFWISRQWHKHKSLIGVYGTENSVQNIFKQNNKMTKYKNDRTMN